MKRSAVRLVSPLGNGMRIDAVGVVLCGGLMWRFRSPIVASVRYLRLDWRILRCSDGAGTRPTRWWHYPLAVFVPFLFMALFPLLGVISIFFPHHPKMHFPPMR